MIERDNIQTIINLASRMTQYISSVNANKRMATQQEIIEDVWIMRCSDNPSLISKDKSLEVSTHLIAKEDVEEIEKALEYLDAFIQVVSKEEYIHVRRKTKTKVNVTSLLYMAITALRKGISVQDYLERSIRFFGIEEKGASSNEVYNKTLREGTYKAVNVLTRMDELDKVMYS